MANDLIIPDLVAWVLFGSIAGGLLGVILSFLFGSPSFVFAGLISGVIAGSAVHWISKHKFSAPEPAPAPIPRPPAMPSDIEHLVKIFDSWAGHSNFVAFCFVVIVAIVAWMAIAITKLHVTHPRIVYYVPEPPPTLPPNRASPRLEAPKEIHRGNLPTKT